MYPVGRRAGRLAGRQPVQAYRVPAQHVLAGGLGLGDAQLRVGYQLLQRLAEHVPTVDGAHPVELWHPYAVGAVQELGDGGYAQCLPREGEHLAVAEERYAVGEVQVDVFVDGGQITALPGVRVALVQQHHGHAAVVRALEHGAQVQRVAGQPRRTLSGDPPEFLQRSLRLLPRPLPDIQPRPVGGDALERHVALASHVVQRRGERILHFLQRAVLGQQAFHQRLEAQHRLDPAASQLCQLVPRQHLFGWRVAGVYEEDLDVRGTYQRAGELRPLHLRAGCEDVLLLGFTVEEGG